MRDALSDVGLAFYLTVVSLLDPLFRTNTPSEGSVPLAQTLGSTKNVGLRGRSRQVKAISAVLCSI